MKEKVIIQTIPISYKGEVRYFQVNLPADARKLIGFETSVKGMDVYWRVPADLIDHARLKSFAFNPTPSAGEMKLQACGSANVFYSTEVKLTDANYKFGDFSQNAVMWKDSRFAFAYMREADPVMIDENCPIISGVYRDYLGIAKGEDLYYEVNLYIWYKTEELL